MYKRLIICLLLVFLSGCSDRNTNTVDAQPYMLESSVTMSIGDEEITYTVMNDEAAQSFDAQHIVILPDKELMNSVYVDFVQGNSLNDFIQAYYNAVDMEKSDLSKGSFQTSTTAYSMKQTEDYNYIVVRGDLTQKEFIAELCARLQ